MGGRPIEYASSTADVADLVRDNVITGCDAEQVLYRAQQLNAPPELVNRIRDFLGWQGRGTEVHRAVGYVKR